MSTSRTAVGAPWSSRILCASKGEEEEEEAEEDMGCVDKAVVVAEVVSSSVPRVSAELRSVDMAVTSVSRCVVVAAWVAVLLLLLLLFPSHSMFWAAAAATVAQLSTSPSRGFFANHPRSVSFAFCFDIGDPDVELVRVFF